MASDHKNEPIKPTDGISNYLPKAAMNWLIVLLIVALIVLLSVFNGDKAPAQKQTATITKPIHHNIDSVRDTITYPKYVYNKLTKRWAVITGKDSDNHHNKWDIFFGSHSLYDAEIEKRIPQQANTLSFNMNWTFSGGKWVTILDSTEDVGLGGEFQFSSQDSAKICYTKFHNWTIRKKEIDDSVAQRTQFVNDSIFNHNHTYQ